MKYSIRLFVFLCILFIQFACKHNYSHVDRFYTEKGDGDMGRLPLIKPYEVLSTTTDMGWCIALKGKYSGIGFCNVKKVTVLDTVILLYTGNTILYNRNVKQSWHVIIPKNDFDKGFDNHTDYLNFLTSMAIKPEPNLYNIDLVASYFDEYEFIDWKKIHKLDKGNLER
ncbi:hypothetical protein [Mucilaginibacter sp.]|uniref:hypothetical protein n=1 Tax=Mucilaginibacter sp. TaxID=1882438 RepID=UPI0032676E51